MRDKFNPGHWEFSSDTDKEIELSPVMEKAERKASTLLEKESIKMESFVDLYGEENVRKDVEAVRRKKEQIESQYRTPEDKKNYKLAKVLEALIHYGGQYSKWFGQNVSFIHASEHDDLLKGVDEVVEIEDVENTSYLALAIDVTTDTNQVDKFRKIKDEIGRGELASIKYFQSGHIRGENKGIPRSVVEAEPATIERMARLWVDGFEHSLQEHPFQVLMLEQMAAQLAIYAQYARSLGNDKAHTAVAQEYLRAFRRVKDILAQKGDLQKKLHQDKLFLIRRSNVLARMKDSLVQVFPEVMRAA